MSAVSNGYTGKYIYNLVVNSKFSSKYGASSVIYAIISCETRTFARFQLGLSWVGLPQSRASRHLVCLFPGYFEGLLCQ